MTTMTQFSGARLEQSQRFTIRSLMTQSTIYRRHEARLKRSLRLRGDDRPAPIRVLSLLPGFRMIVPQFEPQNSEDGNTKKVPKFSEETSFSTTEATEVLAKGQDSTDTLRLTLQAVAATSVAASAAEFLFRLQQQQLHHSKHLGMNNGSNPFEQSALSTRRLAPMAHHEAHDTMALRILLPDRSRRAVPDLNFRSLQRTALSRAAAIAPILFGTKVYLEEKGLDSTLASATAGTVAGVAQLYGPFHTSIAHHDTFAVPSRPIYWQLSHHVLAATLYFGVYEYLRPSSEQQQSPMRFLLAGGVAGSISTAVLSTSQAIQTPMRLASTLVRAAPTHALIFAGYEYLRQGAQLSKSTHDGTNFP